MCNRSQGIKEDGIAIGRAEGEAIGIAKGEAKIILKMYENGFSPMQIADAIDKNVEDVKAII